MEGPGGVEPGGRGGGELVAGHPAADVHRRLADDDHGAVVVGRGVDLEPRGVAVPLVEDAADRGLVVDGEEAVVDRPGSVDLAVAVEGEEQAVTLPARR